MDPRTRSIKAALAVVVILTISAEITSMGDLVDLVIKTQQVISSNSRAATAIMEASEDMEAAATTVVAGVATTDSTKLYTMSQKTSLASEKALS